MAHTPFTRIVARAGVLAAALSAVTVFPAPVHAQTDQERVAQAEALLAEAEGLQHGSAEQAESKSAAISLVTPACNRNHAPACVTLGRAHLLGAGVGMFFGGQVPDAIAAFTRACNLGSGEGCFGLGDYHDPTGLFGNTRTPENWRGAALGFRRACNEHQMAEACDRYHRVMVASGNTERAAVLAYREARCTEQMEESSCEIVEIERARLSAAQQNGSQRPAMDCATVIGMVAMSNPQLRDTASREARTVIQAHVDANGGNAQQLENEAAAAAHARLQAIVSGAASAETVQQEINACRQRFRL
jgi:hypothetical protein